MNGADDAATPATPLEHAVQRLALSRQSLRAMLLPPPDADDAPRRRLLPRRWRAWLRAGPAGPVLRTLEPWVGTMQRTLGRWWRRHPWRPAAELAGGALEQSVLPWVRRRPVTALAIGAAAGAALVIAAPWRWRPLRQAARGSGRNLQRWALHQMTGPAAQAVLASVVAAMWRAQAPAPARSAPRPEQRQDRAADAAPGDGTEVAPTASAASDAATTAAAAAA